MTQIYSMDYTTFNAVELQIRANTADVDLVNDYDIIRDYIATASRFLSSGKITNRVFVPYDHTHEVIYQDHAFDHSGRFLYLPDDCFSIASITNTDGSTINSNLYRFKYQYMQTHSQIELSPNAHISSITPGNFLQRYEITGTWGYHRNYSDAWVTGTTISAEVSDSTTTTITLSNGILFERLMYIKIGTEYMQITSAIPNGSNVEVTVRRGVNGSTATTHTNGATVSYWDIEPDIKTATARLTAGLYRTRHNAGQLLRFADGTVSVDGDDKAVVNLARVLKKPLRIRGV